MSKFRELGLKSEFVDALEKVGYTDPTPIQEQAIPELLRGSDVIGQAQTGTGKTAAFGLPMLQSIIPERRDVQALVLTPTRELCIQVAQSLRAYGAVAGVDVLATFGGAPIRQQMDRLKNGPQVVVGTVGRVLDLHSRHSLMFHDARFVVLDEADEMLDLGFLEDVELILNKCPRGRQTALFSATMPPAIAKLAAEHLHDPVTIKVKAPTLTIDTVEHFQHSTTRNGKVDDLIAVLEAERPTQAIVFARTKIGVDRLARDLDRRKPNLRVRALHGDMSQGSRDGVMIAFKDNRVPVLVATDIAARGLDVQNVTHVINYDLPNSAEIYTHRIGRTGRAGRGGRAITLVEPRDKEDFRAIEKHINVEIPQWSPSSAKRAPSAGRPSPDARPEASSGEQERTPRQRRRRGDEEPATQAAEDAAPIEAAQPRTTDELVTDEPVAAEPVAAEPVAAEPEPEQAEPTEPGPGVIPDRSDEQDAPAPFTWGPPPGGSEQPAEAEAAPEEEPEAAPEAEATPEPEAEPVPEPEPEAEQVSAPREPGELRRPRHVKPDQQELDGGFSLLIVKGGSSRGVEPADVIELVTSKSDLRGNDVRHVRVLSRYTLVQVPTEKAAGVAGAIDGAQLRGEPVAADAVVTEPTS
jgi:ATP-dependent RNA helicase DeaD